MLLGFGPNRNENASFAQPFFLLFRVAFADADADQTADDAATRGTRAQSGERSSEWTNHKRRSKTARSRRSRRCLRLP
jgi:hypothetical protein